MTKSGNGTLTLSGTNTYSGGTIVSAGTLNINYGGNGVNNSAIGTGPLTLETGAQFGNSSGQSLTLSTPITCYWAGDALAFVGINNLNLGMGTVVLGSATVELNVETNVLEVDGVITDTNALGSSQIYGIEKLGAGSLTLSNANTFTGNFNVQGGTVNLDTAGAAGEGTLTLGNSAAIDNLSGAPITLGVPNGITIGSFTFLGTTNLDLGSSPVTVIGGTMNVSNNVLSVDGNLNGANTSITKNGPGAFTIDGNGVSGSVSYTINAGTINADRNSGFPSFGVQQMITINAGGALVVLNPDGDQFDYNSLALNGGLVELAGDSDEELGPSAMNSGILSDNGGSAVLNFYMPNSTVITNLTLGAGTNEINVATSSTLTLNGNVTGTAINSVLVMTGGGEAILVTNSYAANTTVSNGVLSITYPNLSAGSTVTIASAGTLNLNFTNSGTATTNIVAALIVNGVNEPAGVYNNNNLASLTGVGSLLVVPPVAVNPLPGTIESSLSGNTLNLAWPTNAGWTLQSQTNSVHTGISSNWVNVAGSASLTNLAITLNPTNGTTFYRLMYNP